MKIFEKIQKLIPGLSNERTIREAINTYPGGLCFSYPSGKVILVNEAMNRLVFALTGHTVVETYSLWQELQKTDRSAGGCEKIAMPDEAEKKSLIFRFPDGSIRRFEKKILEPKKQEIIQLTADDITKLYYLSTELSEKSRSLMEVNRRKKAMLDNIVDENREKEILNAKMRIHNKFGACLTATKLAVRKANLSEKKEELVGEWLSAINGIGSISPKADEEILESQPEEELARVAELIGCRLEVRGDQPQSRAVKKLLYAAVREGLTNAVRHAGANLLCLDISHREGFCHGEIYSNGNKNTESIRESGGLADLRTSLEREGASLLIDTKNGIRLIVDIPEDREAGQTVSG